MSATIVTTIDALLLGPWLLLAACIIAAPLKRIAAALERKSKDGDGDDDDGDGDGDDGDDAYEEVGQPSKAADAKRAPTAWSAPSDKPGKVLSGN